MKQELVETLIKNIEASNEVFNKATKAQKRVMIAKDCIARIEAKLFFPNRGSLIKSEAMNINKETLNSIECQICAKGGLFASYVGRVNNFDCRTSSVGNWNSPDDKLHTKLSEIFTYKQLSLIECAFEGRKYLMRDNKGNNIIFGDKTYDKAENYRDSFETSNECLIEICENIIRNKGTFKI
jgi:hypothetical protein